MAFKYFSHNGKLLPEGKAVIPLSNIEYSYGFGVYETIRVQAGVPYFLDDHLERLMESARVIGLEHGFNEEMMGQGIQELLEKNGVETCNLKMLLIGASQPENAQLFIICLNPLFPDKKLYRDGASLVTYEYERAFPHAKTLNMLQSYLAYKKAKESGAYDALLLNRRGCITEGTRTNFFCITGTTIFSPREEEILLGVTRKAVLKAAEKAGYALEEGDITWGAIRNSEGAFITSTSSKIIPVRKIDDQELPEPPQTLRELMHRFDEFLDASGGRMLG